MHIQMHMIEEGTDPLSEDLWPVHVLRDRRNTRVLSRKRGGPRLAWLGYTSYVTYGTNYRTRAHCTGTLGYLPSEC